jgi:uncharacterized protein (TIGR02001 family)
MLTRKLIAVGLLAASVLPGVAFAQDVAKPAEPAKAAEPPKPPYSLTANVYIVSDYFFRGITQTWDKPAVQGGFDFIHDSGLYLGTWLSNVSGNQYPGGSLEWDFYGGYNHKINDDFTVGAGLYYYYYPGANFDKAVPPVFVPGVSQTFNTFEGNVSAAWKFVSFKFSYAFSSYFGATTTTGFTDSTSGTYYPELNVSYPLSSIEGLSLIGHVGYTHYSAKLSAPNVNGETNPSYTDWKLGASYTWKDGWTVGAYYVGTTNTDYYKNTQSAANSDVKDLGGTGGYITVGRTF